jgi:hypothetical protein
LRTIATNCSLCHRAVTARQPCFARDHLLSRTSAFQCGFPNEKAAFRRKCDGSGCGSLRHINEASSWTCLTTFFLPMAGRQGLLIPHMRNWTLRFFEGWYVGNSYFFVGRRDDRIFVVNKSTERRLNLSRSWHKGHSRTYNTPFFI